MTILENILLILLIGIIIFIALYIFFNNRNSYEEYESPSELTTSMTSMLQMIDILIELELIEKTQFSTFINESDQKSMMYADETAKEISAAVYEYLNKNILIQNNMLFSNEGIIIYIQKRTISSVLAYINKNVQG